MGAFCEKSSYCLIARSFKYHPVFKMRIPFVLSPARLSTLFVLSPVRLSSCFQGQDLLFIARSCSKCKNSFCPIACLSVFVFSRTGSIVHHPIVFKMQKLFLSYCLFVCLHVFKGRIHCSSPDRFHLVLNSFCVLEAYKGRLLRPTHLSYCLNSHTSNLLLSNHGQLTHLHCSFKQHT